MNKDLELIKEKITYYYNSPWGSISEDIDYNSMVELYNSKGLEYVLKYIKKVNSLAYHKEEYLCGSL